MPDDFHFSEDIPLTNPPLMEAWLEVRWRLDQDRDAQFPFALGVFKESIKEKFDNVTALEQAKIPIEMVPHMVRFRFSMGEQKFPMIQLGPGVASMNYSSPYSWETFKDEAEFLRGKLNAAYDHSLLIEKLVLRYRNIIDFDYINEDLFVFLNNQLNFSMSLPSQIPGSVASVSWPRGLETTFEYELKKPVGKGIIRINTAKHNVNEKRVMMLQLEVLSPGGETWITEDAFTTWLEDAHNVVHEWFFALVDGSLLDKYK